MPAGKDWRRRLPAVLHLAQVISSAKDAGSFEPQMMPAHQAAAMAARVARLTRLQKAAPADLGKMSGIEAGLWGASLAMPFIASSRTGRAGLQWVGRKIDAATGFTRPRRRRAPNMMRKAAPATARDWLEAPELRKAMPLTIAANVASMILPAVASSRWGQRAISWGTRALLRPGVRRTVRAAASGIPRRGVRSLTLPGPTRSGLAGYTIRGGRSGWNKFANNPGRAVLGLNRHLYSNRGSYMLGLGGGLGAYEVDQAWREAVRQRRTMEYV